jgi:hypothetical protein
MPNATEETAESGRIALEANRQVFRGFDPSDVAQFAGARLLHCRQVAESCPRLSGPSGFGEAVEEGQAA